MTKAKLYAVILTHWLFIVLFTLFYVLSFWKQKFLVFFFSLIFVGAISWIPNKDCPLLVWENRIRKKIDAHFKSERFFILMRWIEKLFGVRLPKLVTPYMVVALIILRLLV
ncbi:MAG: DUF2784 family protein [Patescibacteria group bacterium]